MMVGIDPGQPGGDGVINFDERAEGLTLTGTMAADTTEVSGDLQRHHPRRDPLSGDGNLGRRLRLDRGAAGRGAKPTSPSASSRPMRRATAPAPETTITVDTYVNELDLTSALPGGDGVVNFDENGQPIALSGVVEPGSTVQVTLHRHQPGSNRRRRRQLAGHLRAGHPAGGRIRHVARDHRDRCRRQHLRTDRSGPRRHRRR